MAFLNDYIDECLQNKHIFLEDFLQDIQPSEFDMKFNGTEVELKFTFEIDEEDQ